MKHKLLPLPLTLNTLELSFFRFLKETLPQYVPLLDLDKKSCASITDFILTRCNWDSAPEIETLGIQLEPTPEQLDPTGSTKLTDYQLSQIKKVTGQAFTIQTMFHRTRKGQASGVPDWHKDNDSDEDFREGIKLLTVTFFHRDVASGGTEFIPFPTLSKTKLLSHIASLNLSHKIGKRLIVLTQRLLFDFLNGKAGPDLVKAVTKQTQSGHVYINLPLNFPHKSPDAKTPRSHFALRPETSEPQNSSLRTITHNIISKDTFKHTGIFPTL